MTETSNVSTIPKNFTSFLLERVDSTTILSWPEFLYNKTGLCLVIIWSLKLQKNGQIKTKVYKIQSVKTLKFQKQNLVIRNEQVIGSSPIGSSRKKKPSECRYFEVQTVSFLRRKCHCAQNAVLQKYDDDTTQQ